MIYYNYSRLVHDKSWSHGGHFYELWNVKHEFDIVLCAAWLMVVLFNLGQIICTSS